MSIITGDDLIRCSEESASLGRHLELDLPCAARPMFSVEHAGIEQIERPAIVTGGQVGACTESHIASAVHDKLADYTTALFVKDLGLLGAAAAGTDQHVKPRKHIAADVAGCDGLEGKV